MYCVATGFVFWSTVRIFEWSFLWGCLFVIGFCLNYYGTTATEQQHFQILYYNTLCINIYEYKYKRNAFEISESIERDRRESSNIG